jgi:hypothetical protein
VIDHIAMEILVCLEKEPFRPATSLAEALKVSVRTVLPRLHDSVGMKNYHLRWVPYPLTDDLKWMRVAKSEELLTVLQAMEEQGFHNLVTGAESWFYLDYCPATQWSVCADNVEPTAKRTIAARKFIVIVIFGIDGFHVVDVMPQGRSFDSEYFLEHVMQPLTDKFYPGG